MNCVCVVLCVCVCVCTGREAGVSCRRLLHHPVQAHRAPAHGSRPEQLQALGGAGSVRDAPRHDHLHHAGTAAARSNGELGSGSSFAFCPINNGLRVSVLSSGGLLLRVLLCLGAVVPGLPHGRVRTLCRWVTSGLLRKGGAYKNLTWCHATWRHHQTLSFVVVWIETPPCGCSWWCHHVPPLNTAALLCAGMPPCTPCSPCSPWFWTRMWSQRWLSSTRSSIKTSPRFSRTL